MRPNDSPPNPGAAICLRGVTRHYPAPAGQVEALKGIDLDIYPGEFAGVFGKSGAGKTTLMNMITGVDRVTGGEVWVAGTPVHRLNENDLARWRGSTLGVIYQSFQLMPSINLLANVALPVDFAGPFQRRKTFEQALDLLRQVELQDHAWKLPSAISGGQQQRVAIARALANHPGIIVADEPTGRLDSVTADTILQIFLRLVKEGKTIIMVTHDTSLTGLVSRVIHLEDGRITSDSCGEPHA